MAVQTVNVAAKSVSDNMQDRKASGAGGASRSQAEFRELNIGLRLATLLPWRIALIAFASVAATGLFVAVALADKIYLKNGRTLEGIVHKETKERVTLAVGTGDITLRRDQIKRIERTGAGDNARMEDEWRSRYFDNDKYVPEGCLDAVQRYRALVADRQVALDAIRRIPTLRDKRQGMLKQLEIVQGDLVTSIVRGKELDQRKDPRAFNDYVTNHNAIFARQGELSAKIKSANQEEADFNKAVASYTETIAIFSEWWKTFRRTPSGPGADPEERERFVAQVDQRLAGFEREFKIDEVPVAVRKNNMVVDVRFNDSVTAPMLIDTGASFVSLSEGLAEKLALRVAKTSKITLTLADGSQVDGHPVILDSVAVGPLRLNGVQAVVVPSASQALDEVDGLLGMSFLGSFIIRLNPAGRTMIVTRLAVDVRQ